jgi:hypothetical protein
VCRIWKNKTFFANLLRKTCLTESKFHNGSGCYICTDMWMLVDLKIGVSAVIETHGRIFLNGNNM